MKHCEWNSPTSCSGRKTEWDWVKMPAVFTDSSLGEKAVRGKLPAISSPALWCYWVYFQMCHDVLATVVIKKEEMTLHLS